MNNYTVTFEGEETKEIIPLNVFGMSESEAIEKAWILLDIVTDVKHRTDVDFFNITSIRTEVA